MRSSLWLFFVAVLVAAIPSPARAGDGGSECCAACGRHVACAQKTCQIVCDVKKEKKSYWCVECEEICTLLPGRRECGECSPPPRCGSSKCVKKLVKKEYSVEVPVYKCVVLYLCPDCAAGQSAPSASPVPAAPAPPDNAPLPPRPPAPTRGKTSK